MSRERKRMVRKATAIGVMVAAGVMGGTDIRAQTIDEINAVDLQLYRFGDFPSSNLTVTNEFPDVLQFDERDYGDPVGFFANQHVGWLAIDDGESVSRFQFQNEEGFDLSVEVTLDVADDPEQRRKEAGIRMDTMIGGEGLFIVTSDGEVAAFGAFFPFVSNRTQDDDGPEFGGAIYTPGETATLRMIYTPGDGEVGEQRATMEYFFNGVSSGARDIGNLENGVINNSILGFYAQNALFAEELDSAFVVTTFESISIQSLPPDIVLGDLDGNGVLDAFDVAPFELALADQEAYLAQFPGLDPVALGDVNGDGVLDAFDVSPFEMALAGAGGAVPEPASLALLVVGGMAMLRKRR